MGGVEPANTSHHFLSSNGLGGGLRQAPRELSGLESSLHPGEASACFGNR